MFAIMNQHVAEDPPSIVQFNATVLPALATVVMRAIRRDPGKRYASVGEMAHDLRNLDEVVPVPYHPDRSQRGGRYRQVMYVALIIIAICLVIIAFGVLAQVAHGVVR